jgi:Helix-turn-helix
MASRGPFPANWLPPSSGARRKAVAQGRRHQRFHDLGELITYRGRRVLAIRREGEAASSGIVDEVVSRGPVGAAGRHRSTEDQQAVGAGPVTSADGPIRESFGALLRRHREQTLVSQEQLAERSGLSARAIRNLESGRTRRRRTRPLSTRLRRRRSVSAMMLLRQRRCAPGRPAECSGRGPRVAAGASCRRGESAWVRDRQPSERGIHDRAEDAHPRSAGRGAAL